jgi:hypothetical protein
MERSVPYENFFLDAGLGQRIAAPTVQAAPIKPSAMNKRALI